MGSVLCDGMSSGSSIERAARFDSLQRATLVFDRNTRIERDPHGALRKLWLDMPPAMSVLG
jgi:hypothetical protein